MMYPSEKEENGGDRANPILLSSTEVAGLKNTSEGKLLTHPGYPTPANRSDQLKVEAAKLNPELKINLNCIKHTPRTSYLSTYVPLSPQGN